MGAPKGNANGLKNGARAMYRLILGELPAKWLRVKRYARQYRRDLEAAVIDRYGSVGVVQAHTIDAAASWVAHAGICRWLLNNKSDVMSTADIAKCSSEIANAAERRNRLVRQLGIEPPSDTDVMAAFYLADPDPPDQDDPTPAQEAEHADSNVHQPA